MLWFKAIVESGANFTSTLTKILLLDGSKRKCLFSFKNQNYQLNEPIKINCN